LNRRWLFKLQFTVRTPRQYRKYGKSNSEQRNGLWNNNVVPYVLSSRYSEEELVPKVYALWMLFRKSVIIQALFDLQLKACFRFVKRTTQTDYLDIRPLDGCYSFVGRIGGPQLVSLASGCIAKYVIMHEIMHAIGFEHEHQRPDRDEYIKVIYANVQPEQMSNFEKLSPSEVRTFGLSYDYKSIMHYEGTAFGKYDRITNQKLVTMVPLKEGISLLDNTELSPSDIEKLNLIGECKGFSGFNLFTT
uniref:Metalloendopeptidase n=1 Tax=Syphacia muris TaxID=451379 RepID=A0A0N5AIR0_9BILA